MIISTQFKTRLKASAKRAFTLVETVLAVGIVSTVLVALLGLLPSGMDIMGEASQRTVGARINQQIISELQLAEFDDIDAYNGTTRYFDDMGTELRNSGDPIFTVRVEVDSMPQVLPGGQESEHLKRVIVKVSNSLTTPDFSDNQAGREYFRYASTIVKLSQDEVE